MSDDLPFRRLLDDAGAAEAIRRRAGRGAIRSRLGSTATLHGILAELTDLGGEVTIRLHGRDLTGTIDRFTREAVVVRSSGHRHIARIEAIDAIRVLGSDPATPLRLAGDDVVAPPGSWSTVVLSSIEPGDEITAFHNGQSSNGTVRSISSEIVQLATTAIATTYLVVGSADWISVSAPGSIRHDAMNDDTSSRVTRITRPNR